MYDLKKEVLKLFSSINSYNEGITVLDIESALRSEELPEFKSFNHFLKQFKLRDKFELTIGSYSDYTFESTNEAAWEDLYENLIEESDPEEIIAAKIHVEKCFDNQNMISIYSLDSFTDFLEKKSNIEVCKTFADLFKEHSFLCFEVLDEEVKLLTKSICFFNGGAIEYEHFEDRAAILIKCEKASLFTDIKEFPLTPYDFKMEEYSMKERGTLYNIFGKLETMLAYLYLVSSSGLSFDGITLRIVPEQKELFYRFDEIEINTTVCNIFNWAFESDNEVERTGIIRNVLSENYKTKEKLIDIEEDIFNSIKSNYILYQKKNMEQYLEMKKNISRFIVDMTRQLQDIMQSLTDALKNNFLALIMFFITVILTDSVDWEDITSGTVLNSDIIHVLKLFEVISMLYLLVSVISIGLKWRYSSDSYKQLRALYSDVLETKDLNNAFKNDELFKKSRCRVILATFVVSGIWILFLIVVHRTIILPTNLT